MSTSLIRAIGHVAIRTPDLDACVMRASTVMGLATSDRDGDGVFLTEGAKHHSLHYLPADRPGLDHIGLEAADRDALLTLRGRLKARGIPFVEGGEDMFEDAIRFQAPEGFVFEVYVGMPLLQPPAPGAGVRPTRFGHVTLSVTAPETLSLFLREVLDFRVSDAVAGGYFLRCNVDHHGIGVLPGRGIFHHHAWEVTDVSDIARLSDLLTATGLAILWGPVRHGAGNNIAVYFEDPSGAVIECYTEMQRIYDDSEYVVPEWDMDEPYWYSLWSPIRPEGFKDYGIPPLPLQR